MWRDQGGARSLPSWENLLARNVFLPWGRQGWGQAPTALCRVELVAGSCRMVGENPPSYPISLLDEKLPLTAVNRLRMKSLKAA